MADLEDLASELRSLIAGAGGDDDDGGQAVRLALLKNALVTCEELKQVNFYIVIQLLNLAYMPWRRDNWHHLRIASAVLSLRAALLLLRFKKKTPPPPPPVHHRQAKTRNPAHSSQKNHANRRARRR